LKRKWKPLSSKSQVWRQLKENVKEEEEGTKKVIKEEINASFQMLEEEFKRRPSC